MSRYNVWSKDPSRDAWLVVDGGSQATAEKGAQRRNAGLAKRGLPPAYVALPVGQVPKLSDLSAPVESGGAEATPAGSSAEDARPAVAGLHLEPLRRLVEDASGSYYLMPTVRHTMLRTGTGERQVEDIEYVLEHLPDILAALECIPELERGLAAAYGQFQDVWQDRDALRDRCEQQMEQLAQAQRVEAVARDLADCAHALQAPSLARPVVRLRQTLDEKMPKHCTRIGGCLHDAGLDRCCCDDGTCDG